MKFRIRAAFFAAVTFCAGAIVAGTTPGLAFEMQDLVFVQDNVSQDAEVPPPAVAAALPALREALLASDQAHVVFAKNGDEIVQPVPETVEEDMQFASLADAVAAQDVSGPADRELRCLAVGIYYESKGEPLAGQLAVARVILNRAESSRYPASVCSVLTQRGQFSFVRGGRLPTPPNNAVWRRALAVAHVAQRDLWESPAEQALFFHANYVSPRWRKTRVATIGNHIFYR
jgi:spore germination cell wall hydrolase CwlJ-like protein